MRKTSILLGLAALALVLTGVVAPTAEAAPHCSSAAISGPSNVYAETSCVTPVWSIHCGCNGGVTPTYSWTIDGSFAGTGSSATRLYCPQSPPDAYTMSVNLTVTCGRTAYKKSQSVFVSLCDNTFSPPVCLG